MNPSYPPSMFFSRSSPDLLDDVEMLQTDVMRFFAILCLCLTAIFALVKALPVGPPEAAPTIVEPADLRAEAESLREKIAALKADLIETRNRTRAAATAAANASAQADRAAKSEEVVLARIAKAKQELQKISRAFGDTQREIETREQKLAVIVEDIAGKRRVHSELKEQIKNETKNLLKIRTKIAGVKENLQQNIRNHQTTAKLSPREESIPEQEPEQNGFTLRFASDDALGALISEGKVKFYAIAGKKVWQLIVSGGKPVYLAASLPRQIYEMETLTVPTDYVTFFQRQIAAFGLDSLTWGVALPAKMTDLINQLVAGHKGGDLVITADGEVKIN